MISLPQYELYLRSVFLSLRWCLSTYHIVRQHTTFGYSRWFIPSSCHANLQHSGCSVAMFSSGSCPVLETPVAVGKSLSSRSSCGVKLLYPWLFIASGWIGRCLLREHNYVVYPSSPRNSRRDGKLQLTGCFSVERWVLDLSILLLSRVKRLQVPWCICSLLREATHQRHDACIVTNTGMSLWEFAITKE